MNLDDQITQAVKDHSHDRGGFGLSDQPWRASYGVAAYLLDVGYTIVPINPNIRSVFGLTAYPDLRAAARDFTLDLIDVFAPLRFVPDIVDDAIDIGAKAIWLQLGVVHDAAAQHAAGRFNRHHGSLSQKLIMPA
ncbi:MAG: CoA-binding protein [Anaerolineae bacterium]